MGSNLPSTLVNANEIKQRIIERDGLTEEEVISRMKNQISQDEKKKLSDFLILNNGKTLLLPQILDILNAFKE